MNFNISAFILVSSLFVFSCKSGDKDASSKNGGTFTMAENSPVSTLFPHSVTNQVEAIVVSQIHESLLRLDSKTLEPINGLAEKWEVSPDGKTITFHLLKGARFQDDKCYPDGKGPEITSKDIKFTLELLATEREENYQYSTILKDRLVGVNDFFEKKATSISGIKIIYTY